MGVVPRVSDPQAVDVILVPQFLELGTEDRLGLEDVQGPGLLLIAGTGGDGPPDGPQHAPVAAVGERAAGAVLEDLLDGVAVEDLAGARVVGHPLAGADVRHMGLALALGEGGLDGAVGKGGRQLLEVVEYVIGLGPQGVVGHVGTGAVDAAAQGLVGGARRRVVPQQAFLGRPAGVDGAQVVAEQAGVVGDAAPAGPGEKRREAERRLVGLTGKQGEGVAIDPRQDHRIGQCPTLPLGRPPRLAHRIAPGQRPGHPGGGDAEQPGEDPRRPAVTVEAERQLVRRSRSSHSSATRDTGGPRRDRGASATPPNGRRSRR
jgi:hypothetical protein